MIGHDALVYQIQRQQIGHFPHDQPRFVKGIGLLQHLAGADAVGGGAVGLDVRQRAGFPTPGVVDEQLRVDAEELVEKVLAVILSGAAQRTAGDITHRVHSVACQLARNAAAYAPEVGQRPVRPELPAIAHLVKLRNAHAVLIRRNVLGADVHGDFAKIDVFADARRGRDAGVVQYVQYDAHGEFPRGQAVGLEIGRCVDEYLVDGIDVNVVWRDVF